VSTQMSRLKRIIELQEFIKSNMILWNNPIHRRQIIETFALKWGLRTKTVVDYVEQINASKYSLISDR